MLLRIAGVAGLIFAALTSGEAAPAASGQTIDGWGAPRTVAVERAAQFSSLRMAMAPDGRALLVWASRRPDYAIRAVDVAPDGTLGPVRRVSPLRQRASGPQVGIARDGSAVVAWREGRSRDRAVMVATRAAGATAFGAPVRLSPAGGRSLLTGLDVAPDGTAVVAWRREPVGGGWRVQVSQRAAAGAFSAPRVLSTAGAGDPQVAVGGDGSAIVVWAREAAGGTLRIEASTAAPGQALGVPAILSRTASGSTPRVAADAVGGAVVAWGDAQGAGPELRAVTRPSSSAPFGAVATVERSGASGGFAEAEVAFAACRAYAAWADFDVDPPALRVARTDANGAWGPGERISDRGSAAFTPELRAAGEHVVVIWDDIPQDGPRFGHLAASASLAGGPWTPPRTLSDARTILQSGTSPRLGVAPNGVALAAYVDYGFVAGSGRGRLSIVRREAP